MLIKDGFSVHILKKQPDPNDLAVCIIYFTYSTELATNNEDLVDATYHESKRIGDRVHAVAMAWYHLKSSVAGLFVDLLGN